MSESPVSSPLPPPPSTFAIVIFVTTTTTPYMKRLWPFILKSFHKCGDVEFTQFIITIKLVGTSEPIITTTLKCSACNRFVLLFRCLASWTRLVPHDEEQSERERENVEITISSLEWI